MASLLYILENFESMELYFFVDAIDYTNDLTENYINKPYKITINYFLIA